MLNNESGRQEWRKRLNLETMNPGKPVASPAPDFLDSWLPD
jgi:hypothetical protein